MRNTKLILAFVLALSAKLFNADVHANAGLPTIYAALPALSPKIAELTQSEASNGLKDPVEYLRSTTTGKAGNLTGANDMGIC